MICGVWCVVAVPWCACVADFSFCRAAGTVALEIETGKILKSGEVVYTPSDPILTPFTAVAELDVTGKQVVFSVFVSGIAAVVVSGWRG